MCLEGRQFQSLTGRNHDFKQSSRTKSHGAQFPDAPKRDTKMVLTEQAIFTNKIGLVVNIKEIAETANLKLGLVFLDEIGLSLQCGSAAYKFGPNKTPDKSSSDA